MARARNIKPGFFKNEILGTADPFYSLLFEGLWVLADREGRLEDRPLRIKAEVFPYREGLNMESMLDWLRGNEFIRRYSVAGKRYIEINNFVKHQNPHKNETPSEIPPSKEADTNADSAGVRSEKIGSARADSLSSDSLIPDSLNLIPDYPTTVGVASAESATAPAKARDDESSDSTTAFKQLCRDLWASYADAYRARYQVEPVRNAKVNSMVKQLAQRLGEEAKPVAAFYLTHNGSYYVGKMHDLGPLVADAEKLRTEWATNTRMTTTRAKQLDGTQSNFSAAEEAKEILRRKGVM